jgi:hypothetical protein
MDDLSRDRSMANSKVNFQYNKQGKDSFTSSLTHNDTGENIVNI